MHSNTTLWILSKNAKKATIGDMGKQSANYTTSKIHLQKLSQPVEGSHHACL